MVKLPTNGWREDHGHTKVGAMVKRKFLFRIPLECHACNLFAQVVIQKVQLGSKVEVTKKRTKTCYVCFFKDSLNTRAVAPILELNEAIAYTLVEFGYWSTSS